MLNLAAVIVFLPVGAFVLLLSRRARVGYSTARKMLIRYKPEPGAELLIRILEIGEDHRYRNHWGIDFIAILRAIRNFLLKRHLEGASTIEQQYVRTCTLNRKISLVRKLEEATISVLLALSSSKDEVAYSYITCAYFGEGLCGYKAAISALWPEGPSLTIDLYRASAVIAMLKRPRPIASSMKWKVAHQKRVNYIVDRYFEVRANNPGSTLTFALSQMTQTSYRLSPNVRFK